MTGVAHLNKVHAQWAHDHYKIQESVWMPPECLVEQGCNMYQYTPAQYNLHTAVFCNVVLVSEYQHFSLVESCKGAGAAACVQSNGPNLSSYGCYKHRDSRLRWHIFIVSTKLECSIHRFRGSGLELVTYHGATNDTSDYNCDAKLC